VDQLERSNEHVSYVPGEELEQVFRSVMEDSPDEYVSLLRGAFAGQ
jgi:hypothetical protein